MGTGRNCTLCGISPVSYMSMEDLRYKDNLLCMRTSKPDDTLVNVGGNVQFGGSEIVVIAGPENHTEMCEVCTHRHVAYSLQRT